MKPEPAGVQRECDEGFLALERDDPGDADVADGDLVVALRGHGWQDPPEPLHLHPVGQLHHHGPAVEVSPGTGLPEVLRAAATLPPAPRAFKDFAMGREFISTTLVDEPNSCLIRQVPDSMRARLGG